MNHSVRYAVAAVLLLALGTSFFFIQRGFSAQDELLTVQIGGQAVRVAVADTPPARSQGLSGRAELPEGEGMLFVFERDGVYAFWMKDMLFSIDIVWLAEDGEVVDIAADVSPDTFPHSFSPRASARYALELPAGFVEEYSVKIGDFAEL